MKCSFSPQRFAAMDQQFQRMILGLEGVDMQVRISRSAHQIYLYSLFNFYVELWYCRKTKQLEKMVAFRSYKRLDPYLQGIDIRALTERLQM